MQSNIIRAYCVYYIYIRSIYNIRVREHFIYNTTPSYILCFCFLKFINFFKVPAT